MEELTERQFNYYTEIMCLSHNYLLHYADAGRELIKPEVLEVECSIELVHKFIQRLIALIIKGSLPNSNWFNAQQLPKYFKAELLKVALTYEVMSEPNPYIRKH